MQKALTITSRILIGIVLVLAILLAGVRVFGIVPYAVLSGSMEPVYPVGAMLYVMPTAPENIQVGDAITVRLNPNGTVLTHRVTRIDEQSRQFFTKGDANETEDAQPTSFDSLIGKPAFSIPGLGYAADFLGTSRGRIVGISAGIIVVVLVLLPELLRWADKKDRAKADIKEGQK